MAAKKELTILAGAKGSIEPHPDATSLRWKIVSTARGGGIVRASEHSDVAADTGVEYEPGEGEVIVGDSYRVNKKIYFHAIANTVITWDCGT